MDAKDRVSGGIPVVLIHGALRGRLGLRPTARFLERHGFECRTFGYPTRRHGLERHGAALEEFIEEWLHGRRVPTLGLLTHSMGGLVARAYLARARVADQSAQQRLVMLAPPNQGSALAERARSRRAFHWLYGRAARDLLPENARRLPLPPETARIKVLAGGRLDGTDGYHPHLPGNDDGVVGVEETVLGHHEPEVVGGVHSFLQWRPDVLNRAVRFLADADA